MGLVLVVEDDPAIAAQVEAILTCGGHRVILANRADGLDVARRRRPDVILFGVASGVPTPATSKPAEQPHSDA
ncbi:MAG TPA: hypothetical protein VGQ92_15455 [Actinoplanes sp.]|nr:hypothetical protein [Actinoplanes sp.]